MAAFVNWCNRPVFKESIAVAGASRKRGVVSKSALCLGGLRTIENRIYNGVIILII